jgi:hypothetical protein
VKDNFEIVKRQLGRKTLSPCDIVSECPFGFPDVIQTIPSDNNLNIKTIFWLTCPYLNKRLANLEEHGFIRDFSHFLKENREELKKFSDKYRKIRNKLLSENGINKKNIPEDIIEAGIAGVAEDIYGKCLHAHIAYYLLDETYFPGKLIEEKVGNLFCNGKPPVCSRFEEEINA